VQRQKLKIIAFIGEEEGVSPVCFPYTENIAKLSFPNSTENRNLQVLCLGHFMIR